MFASAKVGYIRHGIADQRPDEQLAGLALDRLFKEKISGKSHSERLVLKEAITCLRKDDELFVQSMDRLARNLDELLLLIKEITEKGASVHFLKERLTFSPEESSRKNSMLAALSVVAEFEKALLFERRREGIAQAKLKGAYKGRKPLDPTKVAKARELFHQGKEKRKIAEELSIGRTTVYKYLKSEIIEKAS